MLVDRETHASCLQTMTMNDFVQAIREAEVAPSVQGSQRQWPVAEVTEWGTMPVHAAPGVGPAMRWGSP